MISSREPEEVIISRNGSVLGKKTVLKSDHFPGCQNKKLLPHVHGAPNYRQVSNLPVYGVAIPTIEGIREVLHLIGCSKSGGRPVLWHNMREEPVIYINGRPFVLREVERPFNNLEYTGIDRDRVEQMEMRLKEDVLLEAAKYANKIMVSDELPDGQMVDQWEPIGPDSVQTPLEVYESLQGEGYPVKYERVPVTDEKSPKERDFDLLVRNLCQLDESVAQVFNCQMGRGRTTTGMVVATLVYLRKTTVAARDMVQYFQEASKEEDDTGDDTEESLRKGEYTVIRSVTRVLEGGLDSKRHVDLVIDQCSAMQNLREAILQYRKNILRQADEKKRQAALSNFVEYLERYYFLICFSVYLRLDPRALQPRTSGGESGFRGWMKERPELYSILRRLLRRDPVGALGYGTPMPGQSRRVSLSSQPGLNTDMGSVVASRSGDVLGKQTCLKSDHCPGCQSTNLPDLVEGAPNFRGVPGFPVFGVANPTLEGIRALLRKVGGGPGGRTIIWHNMREEPTVYINGKPYVLREVERPFKNMLEYTGIDTERVEKMEARLKEDVLREAERYNGSIMVNHETAGGEIFDVWENVLKDSSSVLSPVEAYKSLREEGFNVEYSRVPITDGKAPKSANLDTLTRRIADADKNSVFVFNCQMGRGRTTTGTVIATLVLTRCMYGRPLKVLPLLTAPKSDDDDSNSDSESPKSAAHISKKSSFGSSSSLLSKDKTAEASSTTSSPAHADDTVPEASLNLNLASEGHVLSLSESDRFSMRMSRFGNMSRSSMDKQDLVTEENPKFALEDVAIVRKITRLVERGSEVRDVLDAVIDRCASMQNIRRAILRYRKVFNNQDEDARVRQSALSRGVEYLERYCMLIAFSAYLESDAFFPGKWDGDCEMDPKRHMKFKAWIKRKPEMNQMKWSMRLRPARVFTIPEVDFKSPADQEDRESVHEAIVRSRTGSVLGRCSILKLSLFPGLGSHSEAKMLSFAGAHNVCKVDGFPVYSMATPTVEGAKNVLSFIGACAASEAGGTTQRRHVIVTDLREEAVMYIKGKPYVLREIDQPVSTLKHVGIEGHAVEQLERRLKEDILEESARMGGRLLLHKEWERADGEEEGLTDVRGFWEPLSPEDVQTPAEVYAELAEEGYRVDYQRTPLTRERIPRASDVDAIQRRMDKADWSSEYLFVSYTGFGGIAYAMAITCLRLHAQLKSSTSPESAQQSSSSGSVFSNLSPRAMSSFRASTTPAKGSRIGMSKVSPLPPSPFTDLCSPPSPRTTVRGVYSKAQMRLPAESVKVALFSDKGSQGDAHEALKRGEYRDVLSLVRLLVQGPASKFEVDAIVDRLLAVGMVRGDILEHKLAMDACGTDESEKDKRASESEAGLRALRRYCYLILYRAYLFGRIAEKGTTYAGQNAFSLWMDGRPELGHMLNNLRLQ